ncbi:autotransporter outer membrane beta-barrel domain-containing protein [Ruegeria sp. SCP11]|uniref:autotransporter family protein n=1 Tax=Ruegeria sp. SCP11 TaxID=3141378 RepID=UPI00333CDF1B
MKKPSNSSAPNGRAVTTGGKTHCGPLGANKRISASVSMLALIAAGALTLSAGQSAACSPGPVGTSGNDTIICDVSSPPPDGNIIRGLEGDDSITVDATLADTPDLTVTGILGDQGSDIITVLGDLIVDGYVRGQGIGNTDGDDVIDININGSITSGVLGDQGSDTITIRGNVDIGGDVRGGGTGPVDGDDIIDIDISGSIAGGFFGEGGDDVLTLSGSSAVGGNFDGGEGSDTIVVEGEAVVTGRVVGGLNSLSDETDAITIRDDANVGSVAGGFGDDQIVISGAASVATSILGEDGNDFISIESTAFAGSETVDGGAGTDTVILNRVKGGATGGTLNSEVLVVSNSILSGVSITSDDLQLIGSNVTMTGGTVTGFSASSRSEILNITGGTVSVSAYLQAGDDVVTWSGGSLTAFNGGDGSDSLNISAEGYDGSQVFDGGDDVSAADGFTDTLTLSGLNVTVQESNLLNWENIVIDGGAVTVAGESLTVGGNGDNGLTITNNGRVNAGSNLALTGNLNVDTSGAFLGTGNGVGRFSVSDSLSNQGRISLVDGFAGDRFSVAGNYTGGGALRFDVDFATNQADTLAIAGDVTGPSTTISVKDVSSGAATGGNVTLVEVDGSVSDGDFVTDSTVMAGAFEYDLEVIGGDVVLVGTTDEGGNPVLNINGAVYEGASFALLSGFGDLPTLQERIGQRQIAVDADGDGPARTVWMRIDGETSDNTLESGTGLDTNRASFQVGADFGLPSNGAGQWVLGLTAQATQVNSNLSSRSDSGSVSADGYGVGATATWYGQRGTYVDLQSQLNWVSADYSSSVSGELANSESTRVFSMSVEAGHEIELANGHSIVPQAQLVYARMSGGSFIDSQDLSVDLGSNDRQIGRLGVEYRIGKSVTDNRTGSFYAIGNVLHDFSSASNVTVSGAELSSRGDRNWAEIGLGGTLDWLNGSALYGEVSYRQSIETSDNYGVGATAGLRILW